MIFLVNAENRRQFAAELSDMHRQRKIVFVDRARWTVPVLGDSEIDCYDREETKYLLAKGQPDGQVLASVRLLPTTGPHLIGDLFAAACRDTPPRGPTVWEVSRFCITPELHGRGIRLGLLWEVICGVMEAALLLRDRPSDLRRKSRPIASSARLWLGCEDDGTRSAGWGGRGDCGGREDHSGRTEHYPAPPWCSRAGDEAPGECRAHRAKSICVRAALGSGTGGALSRRLDRAPLLRLAFSRVGYAMSTAAWWLKQYENAFFSYPPAVAKQVAEELRALYQAA